MTGFWFTILFVKIPSSLGSKNAKNVKKPAAPKQPAKVDDDDDDDIEVCKMLHKWWTKNYYWQYQLF